MDRPMTRPLGGFLFVCVGQQRGPAGTAVLADAVAPHGGVVMWRAFVYNAEVDPARVKRAYMKFVRLDRRFRDNVFVQVKNGPLDLAPMTNWTGHDFAQANWYAYVAPSTKDNPSTPRPARARVSAPAGESR